MILLGEGIRKDHGCFRHEHTNRPDGLGLLLLFLTADVQRHGRWLAGMQCGQRVLTDE
jgi:hypothetical protein